MPASLDLTKHEFYINRELNYLQFNQRVLELALNDNFPLLEKLNFLLIYSKNLDEFFEIRVAELQRQITFGSPRIGPDGLLPQQVLKEVSEFCHAAVKKQYEILNDILTPALEKEKIRFLRREEWNEKQTAWIKHHFRSKVLPVISPIGLDPAHPFPRLVNKSLNFIVSLEGKDAFGRDSGLAIVPAPRSLPRLIRLPDEISEAGDNIVFLSSMIHDHADELFPGMTVTGCYQFRLTRNSDLIVDADEVDDLARALKGELLSRRYGDAVRLEVADNCPKTLIQFLLRQFDLKQDALYEVHGPVNLSRLLTLTDLVDRPDLKFIPAKPSISKRLQRANDMFDAINQGDVLLLHPFESFAPVVDFLREAAEDPQVLAIKITLYRTGVQSEIVAALVNAARNGKEVTAVIELRARFDEEDNIALATKLQEAGAIVVYGVVGYKTHAKMILVVRREGKNIKRYIHMGTGNYHPGNARLYTDYTLLSAEPELAEDVHKIFQQLTGMGKIVKLKHIIQAPFHLHKKLIELIQNEKSFAQQGKTAHIIIKVNSLTEAAIIQQLYLASQAGVKVDLIVRGMCCLRPAIPNISDNIRVRSIVGRFLEHSRVYYFHNDGDAKVFCASADWMERNFFSRVETCFPILDKNLAERIKNETLLNYLADNTYSWELQNDGSYVRNKPTGTQPAKNAQQVLIEKLNS